MRTVARCKKSSAWAAGIDSSSIDYISTIFKSVFGTIIPRISASRCASWLIQGGYRPHVFQQKSKSAKIIDLSNENSPSFVAKGLFSALRGMQELIKLSLKNFFHNLMVESILLINRVGFPRGLFNYYGRYRSWRQIPANI